MFRFHVADRPPAAHQKRPAAPQHDRRGEQQTESTPTRDGKSTCRSAGRPSAPSPAPGRARSARRRPRIGGSCSVSSPSSSSGSTETVLRLQGHAANWARPWLVLLDFRVHRAGVRCPPGGRGAGRLQGHAALRARARRRLSTPAHIGQTYLAVLWAWSVLPEALSAAT